VILVLNRPSRLGPVSAPKKPEQIHKMPQGLNAGNIFLLDSSHNLNSAFTSCSLCRFSFLS